MDEYRLHEKQGTFLQDWSSVTIKGKTKANAPAKKTQFSHEAAQMKKIELSETPPKAKELSQQSRQEIILKRVSKKWSQQDLNNQCSFALNTIRELEAGRLTPSPQQLNTLNRVLGCQVKLD
jgi:ribosome-binding protein aMBF1 (putative translation factor)